MGTEDPPITCNQYLEGQVVARVLPAVDDVEGGEGQGEGSVAKQVREVAVQRDACGDKDVQTEGESKSRMAPLCFNVPLADGETDKILEE